MEYSKFAELKCSVHRENSRCLNGVGLSLTSSIVCSIFGIECIVMTFVEVSSCMLEGLLVF